MPIKWQPFKQPERPLDFPGAPGVPGMPIPEEGWIPFLPNQRIEEPAIDIHQDKNNLYVEISLIGIKPENVEISIEDNILIIQGKSEDEKEIKKKDYLRKEIRKGSFRRVIELPVEVKGNKAVAESKGGVLRIVIPKVAKAISKTKKIPIEIK